MSCTPANAENATPAKELSWEMREFNFDEESFIDGNDAATFADLTRRSDLPTFRLTEGSSVPSSVLSPLSSSLSSSDYRGFDHEHVEGRSEGGIASKQRSGESDTATGGIEAERLSGIITDLITQSSRLAQDSAAVTLDMLVLPLAENSANLVGDTVRSAYDFLQVLKPAPDPLPTVNLSPAINSSFHQSSLSTATRMNPLAPMSSKASCARSDHATLLLILTSYIYMLRAYILLFEKICSFLQQVADNEDQCFQPVPSLFFGQLPLSTSTLSQKPLPMSGFIDMRTMRILQNAG
jgi:hypothetical protein